MSAGISLVFSSASISYTVRHFHYYFIICSLSRIIFHWWEWQ